ncbi:hypothetical protein VO56_02175 [Mycoplasmopsis gallinacea]|uniref:Uncharacterized protein n=1 Tax=Mycoplasmopsis gallinacea TaxID=29556 RepID=A0A0D5ZK72_9BACT|nr:hypothetical protein VO56_02175 [Mycoplasmopsis gallinacea]
MKLNNSQEEKRYKPESIQDMLIKYIKGELPFERVKKTKMYKLKDLFSLYDDIDINTREYLESKGLDTTMINQLLKGINKTIEKHLYECKDYCDDDCECCNLTGWMI